MMPILALLSTGFWMLMIVDCLRNDPDRNTWIWLLIFLNVPGAVIYFVLRRLPKLDIPVPRALQGFTRRHELWEAEAAVRNIGKAHQYLQWGNLLAETGQWEAAVAAYQSALGQEPQNLQALWGLASAQIQRGDDEVAVTCLAQVLAIDPDFKSGEASLAYGQVLYRLARWEEARTHLAQDIRYWGHPEAAMLLAELQTQAGDRQAARKTLEDMLFRVRGAPKFHYRRKQHLVRQAEQRLRSL